MALKWAGRLLAIMIAVTGIGVTAPAAFADGPVTMSGVVRDGGGQPLAGIQVTLQQPAPSNTRVSTTSAADGSYALTVAPGNYQLNLARNPGPPNPTPAYFFGLFGSATINLSADRNQDLTLPFLTVTVNAVDSAAIPVANASVQANAAGLSVPIFPGYTITSGSLQSTATTDGNGQANLRWLPTTTSFSPSSGTITPPTGSNLAPTPFTIPPTTTDTTITVTLKPPVTMSGVVRDGGGQPLAGIQVTLQQPAPSNTRVSTTSAADGSYALTVAPGNYQLNLARNPGPPNPTPAYFFGLFGSATINLSADRNQDLTLPFLTVTVNAVDSAAIPVANASVQANAAGLSVPIFPGYTITSGSLQSTATTDGNGQANLRWLPTTTSFSPSSGTITPPTGSNLAPTPFTIPPTTTDTTITVTLKPPVTMSGVVRDGGGQPLAGIQVTLQQPAPSNTRVSTTSAADGSYALTVAPGNYQLNLARNPGPPNPTPAYFFGLFGSATINLSADRNQDLTLPFLTVTVNAVDSAAIPVANASVQANAAGLSVPIFPGYTITSGSLQSTATTDGNGQANLRWLPTTTSFSPSSGTITPPTGSNLAPTPFTIPPTTTDTTITVTLAGHLDTKPPTLSLPAATTAEATGPSGAVVLFTTTATDDHDPNPSVICLPASGSTFALGSTDVDCTASDASGNAATGSFTITVRDTTAPTLTPPSPITVDATSPVGAAVTYTAVAIDTVDPHPAVTGTPTSGRTFAIGTTEVTLTATDAAGNGSSTTFTVHVRGAAEQTNLLVALVDSYRLDKLGTSLDDKLTSVSTLLAAGKTGAASESLSAFVSQVNAQSGKALTTSQAAALVEAAMRIQHVIGF